MGLFVEAHQGCCRYVDPFASIEERQLDQERGSLNVGAHLAQKRDRRCHGTPRREQVVQDHHPLSGLHGIGLNLDRVGTVFQIVTVGDRGTGEFASFAYHHEPAVKADCQGCRDQEAT